MVRGRRGQGPCRLVVLQDSREPLGPIHIVVDQPEELRVPPPLGRAVVAGARCVGWIGQIFAGQLERQPVVRQQDLPQPPERLRLVTRQPQHLGDGERSWGDASRALGPLGGTEPVDQLAGFRNRGGVVPQLCRPDDTTGGIEGHQTVSLRGHGDGGHLCFTRVRSTRPAAHAVAGSTPGEVACGLPERLAQCRPPVPRVLLADRWRGRRVWRPAGGDGFSAVEIPQDDRR
jgi:hypothetical protein